MPATSLLRSDARCGPADRAPGGSLSLRGAQRRGSPQVQHRAMPAEQCCLQGGLLHFVRKDWGVLAMTLPAGQRPALLRSLRGA